MFTNSSSCTTTKRSKLLTSCLTAVKNMLLSTVKRYMKDPVRIYFSGEVLDKLKARDFNATGLSPCDLSALYTTLPNNLIKDKLNDLNERTFNREGSPYLACNDRNVFLLRKILKYLAWSCQNVCDALTVLLDNIFIRFGSKLYRQVV